MKVKENRITPEKAGAALGLSAQAVRLAMDSGALDIGIVTETESGQKSYIITPKKLYESTGVKLNGYEPPPAVNIDYEQLAQRIVAQAAKLLKDGGQPGCMTEFRRL